MKLRRFRHRYGLGHMLVAALLTVAIHSREASSSDLELTPVGGSQWRWIYDVKVAPPYAYCGAYLGLMVFDIRRPDAPSLVAMLNSPSGQVTGLDVQGDYAFLAAGHLLIADISKPSSPGLASDVDFEYYPATRVTVDGNKAYVACHTPHWYSLDYDGVVVIVDVSDPLHPAPLLWLSTPNSNVLEAWVADLAVSGSLLIAAKTVTCLGSPLNPCYTALPTRLELVDLSVPENPPVVGWIPVSEPRSVTVSGNLVYVPDHGVLRIIDISDPVHPEQVGWLASNPTDVSLLGNRALVTGRYTLMVLDMTRPDSPYVSARYDSLEAPSAITLDHETAYVSDLLLGLRVFDVSGSGTPILLGGWQQPAVISKVVADGPYLYGLGKDTTVHILSRLDPENPTEVARFRTRAVPQDIALQNGLGYIAEAWGGGMQIVDFSAPNTPRLLGNYDGTAQARGVDVSGEYAYLATGSTEVQIVNVSRPAAPAKVCGFSASAYTYSVRVVNGYMYAASSKGLLIARSDSLGWCEVMGRLDSLGEASDIDVSGEFAYLANGSNGLRIIDVSSKSEPRMVATYTSPCVGCQFSVDGVQVVSNRVYLTSDRLHVLDITDPTHPRELCTHTPTANPTGLAVAEPYVYATTEYGIVTLRVAEPTGVSETGHAGAPRRMDMASNFPNPFNAATVIRFTLDKPDDVNLRVYSVLGRWVATLHEGHMPAGTHEIRWDGRMAGGGDAPSGLYLYRLTISDRSEVRKMLLLR
jgi:hypothetical protein